MTREKYAEELSAEILEQITLLRSTIDSMSMCNTLSHYIITIVDIMKVRARHLRIKERCFNIC